jgi:hypothetical protein
MVAIAGRIAAMISAPEIEASYRPKSRGVAEASEADA